MNQNISQAVSEYSTFSTITLISREGAQGFSFVFENFNLKGIGGGDGKIFSPPCCEMEIWAQGLKSAIEYCRKNFYLDHDLHTMHTADDY